MDGADSTRFINAYNNGWNNAMLFPMGVAVSIGSDPARAFQTPMSSKRSRYVSIIVPADYDKALLAASVESDATKRTAEFQDVMKMITDQYCLDIPIYVWWYIGVSTPQVHDFTMNAISPGNWHPESVWLSK
jgi:ABC-type transport system substrate-binding protein